MPKPYIGNEIPITMSHVCNDHNCQARFRCWRYMQIIPWHADHLQSPRAIERKTKNCSLFISFDCNADVLSANQLHGL